MRNKKKFLETENMIGKKKAHKNLIEKIKDQVEKIFQKRKLEKQNKR